MSYWVAASRSSRLNWLVTFAFQKYAVLVWSSVRTVLATRPYAFVSLNSRAHLALLSSGGAFDVNWSADSSKRMHRTEPRRLRERKRARREDPSAGRNRARAVVA